MNQFEKEYYESERFWIEGSLTDEANQERFHITASLIPSSVRNILDVGCGNGIFVNTLLSSNSSLDISAVDRSAKALEYVRTKKVQAEITDLPFQNGQFDCVTCLEVLEHLSLEDFHLAMKEITRVSNKYLIISVPYNERLEESYTKCPSCHTIFNKELHLRNFNDEAFVTLGSKWGFRNTRVIKAGKSKNFRYHHLYKKIFYPEQINAWDSPICPLCGFTGEGDNVSAQPAVTAQIPSLKRSILSKFSALPKLVWPKEVKYYWIIGLFERDNP